MEIPIKKLLILYLCFRILYPRISVASSSPIINSEMYGRIYKALPKQDETTEKVKEGFKLEDYFEIKLPKYKVGPNEIKRGLVFLKNKRETNFHQDDIIVTDKSLVDSILKENDYKIRDVSEDSNYL
jgi:hypothetical protein